MVVSSVALAVLAALAHSGKVSCACLAQPFSLLARLRAEVGGVVVKGRTLVHFGSVTWQIKKHFFSTS